MEVDLHLPAEYQCNPPAYFNDTGNTDEWNMDAYALPADDPCIRKDTVIDIGCGSGFKLLYFFGNRNTVGIDVDRTVDWLRTKLPNRKWSTELGNRTADLVMCVDVVEHVEDPVDLVQKAWGAVRPGGHLVITTVARELLRGDYDRQTGPPRNGAHVREWASDEFVAFCDDLLPVPKVITIQQPHTICVLAPKPEEA